MEPSGIESSVTRSAIEITLCVSSSDRTVETDGRVIAVDISVKVTSTCSFEETVMTVSVAPKVASIAASSMVVVIPESVTVTSVVSDSSVPKVKVLVLPEMVTSVVDAFSTDVVTVSGVIVETVTSSSCLA